MNQANSTESNTQACKWQIREHQPEPVPGAAKESAFSFSVAVYFAFCLALDNNGQMERGGETGKAKRSHVGVRVSSVVTGRDVLGGIPTQPVPVAGFHLLLPSHGSFGWLERAF